MGVVLPFFNYIQSRHVHFTDSKSYQAILKVGEIRPSGTSGITPKWKGSLAIWNSWISVFSAQQVDPTDPNIERQLENAVQMLNQVEGTELIAISISQRPVYGPYRVLDIPPNQRPKDQVPRFIPFLEAWYDQPISIEKFYCVHAFTRTGHGWNWDSQPTQLHRPDE